MYFHVPIPLSPEVLEVSLAGADLSVPGSSVWSVLSSPGLHQGVGTRHCVSQETGDQDRHLLDNILVVGHSSQEVRWSVQTALQTSTWVGYIINQKSDLTPVQDLVYIVEWFRMDLALIFLLDLRKDTLICVLSFGRTGSYKSVCPFLQHLGLMAVTLLVVRHVHLQMRLIQ